MNKSLIVSAIIGFALVGGAVIFAQGRGAQPTEVANNVRGEGKTQIVEISAKGGYAPKLSTAKAGVPTVLRVTTDGTYDCSSAIRIPSLSYSKTMEPTGVTEITIPPQKAGSTLQGVCAMGMYNFSIKFN